MLKENKMKILWSTLLMLVPMALGLCLWSRLPDRVPSHWNLAGEVDGYSSKAFAVFGLNGILLACHLLCVIVTAMDPKRQNIRGKALTFVYWLVPVLGLALSGGVYANALGLPVAMTSWVMAVLGALFLFVGNWMPKMQPNYSLGIRLPWTLHSEDNWRKTHRMAGPLWMVGGAVIMLSAFFGKPGMWVYLAAMAVIVIVPILYSYGLYRKSGN